MISRVNKYFIIALLESAVVLYLGFQNVKLKALVSEPAAVATVFAQGSPALRTRLGNRLRIRPLGCSYNYGPVNGSAQCTLAVSNNTENRKLVLQMRKLAGTWSVETARLQLSGNRTVDIGTK